MGVNLHVDLDTLQLIQGPGQRSAVAALRFKRGDAARLQVVFLENGLTPVAIGNPNALEIQIGIKPRNQFDRSYLAYGADWSMPSEGDDTPAYECSVSFNTLQLNSALNVGSPTAEELPEITLMGEITWREGEGLPTSTRTFLVVVENDVNRGTEGTPFSLETPDEWLAARAIPADSLTLNYTGDYAYPDTPFYTSNQIREAGIGASGPQAATKYGGKWVESLTINGAGSFLALDTLTSFEAPDLVGVVGSISMGSLGSGVLQFVTSVSFPELRVVGSGMSLNTGGSLTSISFPKLTSVGSSVQFTIASPLLTALSLPALKTVGGQFSVNVAGSSGVASLTIISCPELEYAGGFSVLAGPALTSMEFPKLRVVGGSFSLNPLTGSIIASVDFQALRKVIGTFTLSSGGGSTLLRAGFPVLEAVGGLTPIQAPLFGLTTLELPALTQVGTTGVTLSNINNTALTHFEMGPNLKHVHGNFSASNLPRLDGHDAWAASTRYIHALTFTLPASAFAPSPNTAVTVVTCPTPHGLETGDIITVSGLAGTQPGNHVANGLRLSVTKVDANVFTYLNTPAITWTTVASGTANIQREGVSVIPLATKNGRKYLATTSGTSGASEPTWPTTVGTTVVDGTVTWQCVERSFENMLKRLEALDGTNGTTRWGANRSFSANTTGSSIVTTVPTVAAAATTGVITTGTAHGLTTGTQVILSGFTGTAIPYNGIWTITRLSDTTFTLNELTGSGWTPVAASASAMVYLHVGGPQFTGTVKVPTQIGIQPNVDAHDVQSSTSTINSPGGFALPVFVAGNYLRNVSETAFPRFDCAENQWAIWYSNATTRFVMSPIADIGNTSKIKDYPHTNTGVPFTNANGSVAVTAAGHGAATGARVTVLITGHTGSTPNINGLHVMTATSATQLTFYSGTPVTTAGTGGTLTVLNQTFHQGLMMSANVISPIQAATVTVTLAGHGYANGNYVSFNGAQGAAASSINDSNAGFTSKATCGPITVIDTGSFQCTRFATTQPTYGTLTLTQQPLMRRTTNTTEGFYLMQKLRGRGVACLITGSP
jgi:hypothetical protein